MHLNLIENVGYFYAKKYATYIKFHFLRIAKKGILEYQCTCVHRIDEVLIKVQIPQLTLHVRE